MIKQEKQGAEQPADEKPLLWNYHSKHGLFRREEHYFGLLCLICASMVFYCKSDFYLFGSDQLLAAGRILARFFLGLSTIMDGPYDIKTKEFYSLFYLLIPAYFCNGLVSTFFISPYRYKKMIIGISGIKMLVAFLLVVFIAAPLPMLAPMIGFKGPSSLVLFNTIMNAGIIHAAGVMIIAVSIKSKLL